MSAGDRQWLTETLRTWDKVAAEQLKLTDRRLPAMVLFDASCSYTFPAGSTAETSPSAIPHKGKVTLPDGSHMPPVVVSFAAPGKAPDPGFFVMSLPSVWREAGVQSGLGIEMLTTGVLLHELMHAYQFYFANPTLEALSARYGLPDDINDDSVQAAFKDDPAYVRDYEAERDLLYRAAAAPGEGEARKLAGEALAMLRARRARYFAGDKEKWAPLDEIFLTMEGLGQWTIFAWLTDEQGHKLDAATALSETRRGGKQWTQDEGLALFLVIDRLVPGWQQRAFAAEPETVEALLTDAAGSSR
jgi:hypothetical protein